MTQPSDSIYLICPASQGPVPVDRQGGESHGALATATNYVMKEAKIDQISSSLSAQALSLSAKLGESLGRDLADYSVDEICLSLAVTVEGGIGIATAGVQGSVSLVLKRKPSA